MMLLHLSRNTPSGRQVKITKYNACHIYSIFRSPLRLEWASVGEGVAKFLVTVSHDGAHDGALRGARGAHDVHGARGVRDGPIPT